MIYFVSGLLLGLWLVGGLWFFKSPKPFLTERGALCALILSGPIAWGMIFWEDLINPGISSLMAKAKGLLVNEASERVFRNSRTPRV